MSKPQPVAGPTPVFDQLVTELGEPDFTPAPTYEHVEHLVANP